MDAEKLIKSNQEQAVASWLNYLNQIRINRIVDAMQQQNENLQDAVLVLKDTMQTIDLDIIEKNRGGQKGQHGFIAEVAECGIGNAFDKLKGDDGSYSWVNDNGPVDLRRGAVDIQQKFVRSGGLFSLNAVQAHHSKYPDFLNNGEKYQIPKDFYDNILKLYNMSDELDYTSTAVEIRDAAIEFEEQLNWKSDGSDNRDYLEELDKFEEKKLEEWRKIYA